MRRKNMVYGPKTTMNESICKEFRYSLSILDMKDLRSTYIANCIFNNLSTHTAIMLNILTIYAVRKTSSLPRTLRTLLLSLAVSDIGVGFIVQPFYTSFLVKWLQLNDPKCSTFKAFVGIGLTFSQTSFLSVVAVSVDRFLAVHLHLRYHELVTHKRVVTVVISIWVLNALVSLMVLWASLDTIRLIVAVTGAFGFIVTIVLYIRIYFIARRHKNQIQSLQIRRVEQTSEMARFTKLVHSAVSVFYVYILLLACYSPFIICIGIENSSVVTKRFWVVSLTLLFLNSSLNPIIYCWRMRNMRHSIINVLRNMSRNRNRISHS